MGGASKAESSVAIDNSLVLTRQASGLAPLKIWVHVSTYAAVNILGSLLTNDETYVLPATYIVSIHVLRSVWQCTRTRTNR